MEGTFSQERLMETLKNSYSPFSHFPVAAAVESKKGHVYYGTNVENSSYGATICAERSAIVQGVSAEGPDFKVVKVYLLSQMDKPITPCGICRQFIFEFMEPALDQKSLSKEVDVVSFSSDFSKSQVFKMSDLLPEAFKL